MVFVRKGFMFWRFLERFLESRESFGRSCYFCLGLKVSFELKFGMRMFS